MAYDCIVIGAGIAGILAGRQLQERGLQVVILEKSRGVGGRMATRRFQRGVFDHGAQFFTVRDERFEPIAQELLAKGIALEWTRSIPLQGGSRKEDGHPRYRGMRGMNAIPRYLAAGLNVQLNARVNQLTLDRQGWVVSAEPGILLRSRSLLLTAPIPQSMALLGELAQELPESERDALASISYDPCLALLAVLDGPSRIPDPGAIRLEAEAISWLADNHAKGISPDAHGLTIHATPGFSQRNWDGGDEQAAQQLFQAAAGWIEAKPSSYQIHRWRYSKPIRVFQEPFLFLERPAPVVFAGDAFAGPRVEGAAVSGLTAGAFLNSLLLPQDS